MSYTVNWTDPVLKPAAITVADKSYDTTSTSLTLTGKGLQNYGLFQQQNFLALLENFASPTAPAHPTIGQMWYDTAHNVEWFWNGTSWDNQVLRSFSGPTAPADPLVGQLWYDTTNRVLNVWDGAAPTGGGWKKASPQIAAGIAQYSPTPDTLIVGLANRLNRVIGAPTGSAPTTWGWGQYDLVPTYDASGTLDSASSAAQANLPAGLTFPNHFDNNAWAIFLSRLRKALRQTGLDETAVSTVGFVDDGTPTGAGNTLANYYNNYDAGPTPYQGTVADITAGWGGAGSLQVQTDYDNTVTALTNLETYRFTLGASQTQLSTFANAVRTNPTQSLFIPSVISAYTHTVTMTFADKAHADAFFNAGGQLQFNWSFVPSSGSPTNVELDWKNFLLAFQGMAFDYKGVKETSAYLSPNPVFTPTYMPTIPGGSNYYGYFNLGSTPTKIFERDVLSTPGSGLYSSDPPVDGGIVIMATASTVSGSYVVELDIEYYLQHVTGGTGGQNDATSSALYGTMTSIVTGIYANSFNATIAAPAVAQSGTFITAA
jgi:hypothetical protein